MPRLKTMEEVASRILNNKRLEQAITKLPEMKMPQEQKIGELQTFWQALSKDAAKKNPTVPKITAEDLPLETPYVSNRPLPTYAGTPKDELILQKVFKGEDPQGELKKLAQQVKEEKAARVNPEDSTFPGTDIVPTSESIPKLINPADMARRAYDWYNQKLEHAGNKTADAILQTVTPQGLPNRDKIIAETAPAVSFAAQIVGDPTNYIGPGEAKLAANAVQKAGGVLSHGKQIAQASAEALVRQKRAEEALKVLNYLRQEPSTAQKLATKGAPVVQPVGQIFRAK